jgi:hypothetical protein
MPSLYLPVLLLTLVALAIALYVAWRSRRALRVVSDDNSKILANVTDAYFTLDHGWRFTTISPRAIELFRELTKRPKVGANYWNEFAANKATIVEKELFKVHDTSTPPAAGGWKPTPTRGPTAWPCSSGTSPTGSWWRRIPRRCSGN